MNKKEKPSRDWGIIQKRNKKTGEQHWYARIVRVDANGNKKQYTRKADNKSHARRLRNELETKFDDRGEKAIEGDKLRFNELVEIYSARKLIKARYHGMAGAKRKVAGVRSLAPSKHYARVLVEHFGNRLIKDITHDDIADFKNERLATKTSRGERSITDVNRTLELLRTMLGTAVTKGWLSRSPFGAGEPLISKADESRRERVLTHEEEERLLDACNGVKQISYMRNAKRIVSTRTIDRSHVRALVIVAVDTAMRRGELLKLQWKDVDLPNKLINVTAMNTKTFRSRSIGMTSRAFDELSRLWEIGLQTPESLVFGIKDNFKNAFKGACRDAGLSDLKFHDLRHTAITRMVNADLPHVEIMKVSGHTQWTTFARYVNPTTQTVNRIADVLSEYNSEAVEKGSQQDEKFIN